MKLIYLIPLSFLLWSSCTTQHNTENKEGRISKGINTQWTFNYFPQEALNKEIAASDYNDSAWPAIAIPHTWSTYETTGDIHPFIYAASELVDPYWWNGWGWYRKSFEIGDALNEKKITIELDGVQKYCQLYLNGKYIGDHKGGFTSFYFDLTEHIQYGQKNTLAIAVSNRRVEQYKIPPITAGNWNVYGGIYRDVRLVIKNKVHIPYQGSYKHEGGTFITTQISDATAGKAVIKTYVKNDAEKALEVTVKNIISAPDGTQSILESTTLLETNAIQAVTQETESMANPALWSPEKPNLYVVTTEIYHDGELMDRINSPMGFRWFSWNYDEKRLYLNGEQKHIHGTNRHQEFPWLGDAIPFWLTKMDFEDIKYGLGHNFLRHSHYPADPRVYDLTDSMGLMAAVEVPNIKSLDFDEDVQKQNVLEMIRRDRNHPSILFWSMGNETNDAADSRWAHEEDTTRIIHARHVSNNSAGDFVEHTDHDMDMENLLRCTVRGWYNEDVRDLEPVENQHTGHEEWQHLNARIEGGSQRGRIDMGNGVMWMYADHGADREYVNAPLKYLNPKGWVDLYRVPKYLYYLWQANYLDKPMIFAHPHFWREQYVGKEKEIIVDSNCEEVELFVNGKSYGKKYPQDSTFNTVTFEGVLIEKGELKLVGRSEGQDVEHVVQMAGAQAEIKVSSTHSSMLAKQNEVAIITADIVDSKGNHVIGANPDLQWDIEGPAVWVGPSTYTTDRDKDEEREGPMYIDVPVKNVLRATGKPGKVVVSVSSNGLVKGSLTINVNAAAEEVVSGITEPSLSEAGRSPVKRDTDYVVGTVGGKPYLSSISSDIELEKGLSESQYRQLLITYLKEELPQLFGYRSLPEEHSVFLTQLTLHLKNNGGLLVADDMNTRIRQFNNCKWILETITLSRSLKEDEKEALRKEYIKRILVNGEEVDSID